MAGECILIIESSPEHVEFLLTNILSPLGCRAQIAANGKEGVAAAQQERPDLVLLALNPDGAPNTETLKGLQACGDPPVILMTHPGSEVETLHAIRLGACNVLIHPLQAEEATQIIARVLHHEHLARERDWLVRKLAGSNEALEQALREVQTLHDVSKAILSSLDLRDVLTAAVEAAISMTRAEEGYLLLRDPKSGELYLRAEQGLGKERATGLCVRVYDSIARQVLRTGKSVALSSEGKTAIKIRCEEPLNNSGHPVRSLINVPLNREGQVIGVLGVDNVVSEKSFTSNDLLLLSAVADSVSIAINNAQVFARTDNALCQALTELSALQYRTDAILQNVSEGIYTVNHDLRFTSVNPAMARISGWQPNELLGRHYDEVFAPQEDGQRLAPEQTLPGKALCTQSQAVSTQSTILCKDGHRVCVAGTATLLRDGDGASEFVLGTIRDVTPEVEWRRLQHDTLHRSRSQDLHLDQLTEDTLGTLHLGAATTVANRHPVTLKPIISQITSSLRKVTSRSSLQVTLAPDLPFVLGNESKIELALINLIHNALLLSDPEQAVRISANTSDDSVTITIEGSAVADRVNTYEQTSRAMNLPGSENTFGEEHCPWWVAPQIRFYIASKLIQGQGGRVWTDNHSGAITRFHISLPKFEVQDVAQALVD